nr:hypothetical protein [Ganoderma leucocontextum]
MFLRIDIFSSLSNYPNLKIVLLISGIYYSIFLGLNLSCRVSMILFKGIPFFYKEIAGEKKVIYYFIGYLIFNISLIILSIIVLIRISTFYLNYHGDSFYGFMLYELVLVLFMFVNYIYFSFNEYKYELDLSKVYNFTFFQIIVLLIFPSLLLLNFVSSSVFNLLNFGNTIYCQPDDGNGYSQTNENLQESSKTNGKNNKINKNLQGNKNTQLSGTTNATNQTNINNQFNQNQQINTPPLRDGERMIKYHYVEQIQNQYRNHSFWENITYLENLKGKNILSNSFINERINFPPSGLGWSPRKKYL